MAKRFRIAFLERLEQTGETVADVARGAKVSVEQLKKVKQRDDASTNADDAVKVAHYFGLSMDEFLGDTQIQDRQEMLETYFQLSAEERALIKALGGAQRAQGREEG